MNMRFGMKKGMPLVERLDRLSIPEPMSGCTLWLGAKSMGGYGMLRVGGAGKYAHRLSWETSRGPIPDGLVLDHICRNRACINPDHLRVVTMRENSLYGAGFGAQNALKRRCPRNHAYDVTKPNGWRSCRMCTNANRRISRARAKGRA